MSKIYFKAFVIFFCLVLGVKAFGQGASNKGTDFWLGYGKHIAHTSNAPESMVVYITSDVSTTATVSIANLNFTQTVTVPANGIVSVNIPYEAHLTNDGPSPNGIHITSLKPIIVYAHIYASSVSGATLVLPVNALGKDYYSINYKQISNSAESVSWFFVVAVEDDTQVEITPSQDTEGWLANTKHTVNLKKGEIYNVLGKFTNVPTKDNSNKDVAFSYGTDLTGSKIKSISSNGTCKKIAVFSGSSKITVSCLNYTLPTTGVKIPSPGSADNLFQQAYPTDTWGKNFITVPQKERNFVVYRIVKSDPSTVVKVNGVVVNYGNNFYYDFESQNVEQISADKPIQVVQYAVTQGKGIGCTAASGDVGDPEMIFLNPLEQTLTSITMYSTPKYLILKHFINIVVKNSGVATFTLDGVSVSSSFIPVPNNLEYSYAQLPVTAGTHNLVSQVGFNAIAYGFGSAESYGYAAGANLTAFGFDPVIKGADGTSVQTGCVGVSYDLKLKLPYQASQLLLDKNDGMGPQVVNLPATPETIIKDDKIVYVYSLIPQITYSAAGTYTYKVVTTKPSADACGSGDEFLFDFLINPKPVADFVLPPEVCINSPISFKATAIVGQTIKEYLWDFNGEGTASTEIATHTYTTLPGIKKNMLSVKSEDGCWSDVKEVDIEVMPLPIADFSTTGFTCVAGNVQFNDKSTITKKAITKWTWDFGDPTSSSNISTDPNPTHIFNEVKTYNVTLKVTTDLGCENIVVKQVKINPLPVASFNMPDICLNDATGLVTNTSTIADGSALTYEWDFGDDNASPANPNTSTNPNPTHKYTRADIYQVTLIATSTTTGCVTTIKKPFTVKPNPIANFTTPPQACINNVISFQADKIPNQTITEYLWDFNGETTASTEVATHIYSTTGVKKNKLSVKSAAGCWSPVKDIDIDVVALPIANFSQQNITCVGGSIQFTDKSTTATNKIIKWDWDFGDPTSASNLSANQNPSHTFSEIKTYDVSLKVTTDLGCESIVTKQVKISPLPVADFETPDICLSDASALFTNTSTVADGSALTYVWNFGDGNSTPTNNTSNAKNPSHIYTQAKVYQVSLTVTSANGCVTSIIKPFTVNGSTPKSSFTIQSDTKLCSDQEVTFEDHASVDFGEVTKIEWIFDPSDPSAKETDNNPSTRVEKAIGPKLYKHTYPTFFTPATKTVNVKMTAYSGITCFNSSVSQITLKAIPKGVFTLPDGCLQNGEAKFTNQSTFVGSEVGLTYLWDFGDGSATSTDKDPVHSFTSANTYQITLTVTAPNGCVNTTKQPFIVNGAIPKPNFTVTNANNLCSDQVVTFTDATIAAFGEIKKIEWYFDVDNHPNDPAYQIIDDSPAQRSATAKTYQFTYSKFNSPLTVNKRVRMVVTANGDCVDEIILPIILKAVPNVVFNPLRDVCAEVPAYSLTQASENTGFVGTGTYTGDGVDATGLFTPAKAGVGKHTITYTFVGDNGCSAAQSQDITVFETPTADAGIDKIILVGGGVLLDAAANGKNLTYKWTPSTGLSKDDILNPVASPTKDIIYTLMVTSDDGCMLADEVFVKVLQFPEIPNTFTPNGDGVNDTWNIKYLDSYPNSTVKIFNRYGKEVFFSAKYAPWDGKLNGEYLPEGMYYYIITAKDGELKYTGSILLVK